jgi:hypothetical protein
MTRIMTFGYETVIEKTGPTNSSTFFSHSSDLLFTLLQARRHDKNRPLVFIAHSVGGLLVKDVLRRSEAEPDQLVQAISKSTTGIIFFGTPHIYVTRDIPPGLKRIDKDIFQSVLLNASILDLLRESFTTHWLKRRPDLMVRTFQEGKSMTGSRNQEDLVSLTTYLSCL